MSKIHPLPSFCMELIDSKKELLFFMFFTLVVFIISVFIEYVRYSRLFKDKTLNINAKVLLQYKKNDYFVMKIKSKEGEVFYTTSRDSLKDIRGRYIRIYGKLDKKCSFIKYLNSCFIVSYSISLLHHVDKQYLISKYINKQHDDKYISNEGDIRTNLMSSMYKTLFLGEAMDNNIRSTTSALGVSHLFAISGFHLGILSFIIYILFYPFYRILHMRFFTYRNTFYDLSFISLLISFLYLILIDFPPSFLRAFIMFALGLLAVYGGVRLISFKMLLVCILLTLSIFPKIFFSIGFWLSICGVFYIYLYILYFARLNKIVSFFLFNFLIFLNMSVVSHYFFYAFSIYQILSPLLSIIFLIFYPIMLFMHFIGYGGLLDNVVYPMLFLEYKIIELKTPIYFLILFLICSFVAIFNRIFYYFIIILSIVFLIYGILKVIA